MATAATAIAAATALTPAVIAQADVTVPVPAAPAMSELSTIAAAPVLGAVGLAEQSWFYFGPGKDTPPKTDIIYFNTAALIPGFIKSWFSWLGQLNFEACIFGVSANIGPYGTFSLSVSRGC